MADDPHLAAHGAAAELATGSRPAPGPGGQERPDRPSLPRSTESKELRLALLTLLLPLYVAVVFGANYFGALHAARPHGVKVAIVGTPSSTSPIAHELSTRPRGGFDVSRLSSIGQARDLVGARKLAGAYVPGQRPAPAIVVATAASPSLATFVEATFREVAAAQNRALAVDDVKPLPANNASGSPNFFFIVISTLGGFLTVVALGFAAPTLPEPQRLGIVAAASLLAPTIAWLIGGPGYDTFTGSAGAILAMLGLGALYAFAVAVITRLLQLGLGAAGALIGSLILIFLNVPSSGGSVAAPLLPGFWRFLSHFWIGAAALDANRSTLYFGGNGVAGDVLKMLAWVAACACLLAVPIHLRSTRRPGEPRVPHDHHEHKPWCATSRSVAVDGAAHAG
jgi:hypothetical protein